MCGICGIIALNKKPLATDTAATIARMNAALAHRGPDDAGVWMNDTVALGHRRLSIIDLSAAGHQPMHAPDGQATIAFNGEIYNYQDLKKQTPQYAYQSHSDTETLLGAYQEFGKTMLPKLNGMFAFALWDSQKQSLLIARDQLGIKPLYYAQTKECLVFASEIRALLASDLVERRLNKTALGAYLRYQTVYAPQTLIENVQMLPAGHSLEIENGELRIEKFYSLATAKTGFEKEQLTTANTEGVQKAIRQTLREAVGRQMMSDVPFGAFLSGGVDSSVVVALMREVTAGDIETFNISFADKKFDESLYARAIAERFKTKHHEIRLAPTDFLNELPNALNALDHPSGDAVNTYVVAQATRKAGIKMALSGLGGDELFGGYPIFKQSDRLQRLQFLNHVPTLFRKTAGQLLQKVTPSVSSQKMAAVLALPDMSPLNAYDYFREVFSDDQRQQILVNGYAQTKPSLEGRVLSFEGKELYSQISIAEMSGYMQNVLLRDSDQMSMAHALELRVPLLDVELVNLVLNIPDALKRGTGSKPLLVAAMSDVLPPSLFDRPKMGFLLPFETWMRNELRDFCTTRLQLLADLSAFNSTAILTLWDDFLNHKNDVRWSRVWTLVALGDWLFKLRIES
jgi:asparagine synthase (glutamine-hydrolysing)